MTPIKWGDFEVDTTAAGYQSDIQLKALGSGKFMAVWLETNKNPETGIDESFIRVQPFYSGGVPEGNQAFTVAKLGHLDVADLPNVSFDVLSDGRFVVAWDSSDNAQDVVKARIFNANGTVFTSADNPDGNAFTVSSVATEPVSHPSVTALANGRFMISYKHEGIGAVIYDADGKAVDNDGLEFVDEPNLGAASPQIFKVDDTHFTVVYTVVDGAIVSLKSQTVSLNIDGSVESRGQEQTIADGIRSEDALHVVRLKDGRLVSLWQETDIAHQPINMKMQLLSNTGEPIGTSKSFIDDLENAILHDASVTMLANGGFAVSYIKSVEDADDPALTKDYTYVAVLNQNLERVGEDYLVTSTPTLAKHGTSITQVLDGRIIVTWGVDPEGDADDGDLVGTVLDYRTDPIHFIGTEGTDQPVATHLDDILEGRGGDDHLVGRAGNDLLLGGADRDKLEGGEGNDTLDGGTGADTLEGGIGDDIYIIDDLGDVIRPDESGNDKVQTSISFTLTAGLEVLAASGTAAISLTGNELANTLIGNEANNTLDGGAGADTMQGGAGDDVYIVDNAADVIDDSAGIDTVLASFSYSVANTPGIENITATGNAAINLTGNAAANKLTGNDANNIIDGGMGSDVMVGGAGDDTYYVDDAGDVVTDSAGFDTVITTGSYSLASMTGIESLMSSSTTGVALTGNAEANTLTGTLGNDTLDGGMGADILNGGLGNDTYLVDTALDVIVDAGGTDTVVASASYTLGAGLENLTASGPLGLILTGNALANTITGGTGKDKLVGGLGADVLTGGLGADTFVFTLTKDTAGRNKTYWDQITDFNTKQKDRIDLKGIDANTKKKKDQKFSFIKTEKFHKVAGELRYEKVGKMFKVEGDVNGDGKADFTIQVKGAGLKSIEKSYFIL